MPLGELFACCGAHSGIFTLFNIFLKEVRGEDEIKRLLPSYLFPPYTEIKLFSTFEVDQLCRFFGFATHIHTHTRANI